ncbi:sigma-70 family RNA polymerase sigma factor [Flavobacterium salilacus subsp. salilacus]|uniref:RNA polymerase sigma factor n=1 Tax=Flavobacterium TaxID=237 RepID=UPI0010758675|nr:MULTISPECIES: sigma-70 family RNA polymerase sigma factor [Flavobacterium]KAF2518941.1 sigma-70 family RNA polymerase sigma factor [Flavobacterium salilacus subsp. salilacus]MBE1614897.1 sigma-70 family RNA polymerase sigma factor [Flavobacterium sp. SaA2.13]
MGIEQLIKDCQKNNIKAQEQLYRLFAPKLFAVCLKYSRNYEDAQDNMQDGFLLLFRKIEQFQFKGSFEGWARRLMVNNVLQKYRSEGVFELVSENMPEGAEVEIESDSVSMDFLLSIIQELPDRYRMVFNLYVTDGYSHKEIAEMLGITIGTSKSNLSRARLILKEKIEAQEGNSKNTYSR